MKNLLFILFCFSSFHLSAQSYFNQMYNKRDRDIVGGTGRDEAWETQIYNNQYYIRQSALSENNTHITVLNKEGEIVNEGVFNDLLSSFWNSKIMTFSNDSLFIVEGIEDIELQISNPNLDSLDRITLPLSVFEGQFSTSIKGLVVNQEYIYGSGNFGYPYSGVDSNYATNGLFFKMNKHTLEIDTIIRYQYENAERTGFGSLTVEDNGDMLVTFTVQMEDHVGTVEPEDNLNRYTGICRFDSDLNLIWEYIIPNFGYDSTAHFYVKLSNGNIVMSDVGTYSDSDVGSAEDEPALHCIDPEGNTLWRLEEYEFSTVRNLFSYTDMIATQDGGVIVSSDYIDWDPFFPGTTTVEGGRLRKVSAEGDLLWDRLYLMTEELEEGGSTSRLSGFKGVIEDENGDLFAYGHIDTDSSATSTDVGHWFVRTDSYGCVIEGCEVTSIDLMEVRRTDYFSVVNPAFYQIKVELSEDVSSQKSELILYSLTGKELIRQKVSNNSQLQIEVANYSSGMYLLQLQENGKVLQTEKVIVQ
ncbi:MAG: hypothetical protein ACI85O_000584 [Saprospiraceae bacterium]|jgi:hypothetical protein